MRDTSKYLLALNAHPHIGSQTTKKILAAFDAERAWLANEGEVRQRLEPKIATLLLEARAQFDPETELDRLLRSNIGHITIYDKDYPPLLKEIYDAPAVLYIRGEIKALQSIGLAIVGSRKHSPYGRGVVRQLARQCVEAGLAVISGLALGIDGEAHRTTLESGGPTIAVLGCGLDQIYPASHLSLANRIIEEGGAIISEFSPGTPALPYNFPQRNRIIAGLSLGTLVIEASENSGSLITAECALEYNREVFAVPGPIDSPYSRGTNLLIQKGAKLTMSVDDIISELPVQLKKSQAKIKEILAESKEESSIWALLIDGEKSIDDIITASGLNIIAVNTALTMMEMKGMIESVGGGRYRKIC